MTPSITEDAILTGIRAFLLAILPDGTEVIQGQTNRVAEPIGPDFVVMMPAERTQLGSNVEFWDTVAPPTIWNAKQATQFTVQLDIHGPGGSDNAQSIVTLWRSDYGCQAVDGALFQPLYATHGSQMPFVNGENQYENRWVVVLALQANPIVSTPAPFADSVSVTFERPTDAS